MLSQIKKGVNTIVILYNSRTELNMGGTPHKNAKFSNVLNIYSTLLDCHATYSRVNTPYKIVLKTESITTRVPSLNKYYSAKHTQK